MPEIKQTQRNHSNHRRTSNTLPLCLLADGIRTPNNVGGLFRIADALGVEKIYLAGNSACPPQRKLSAAARSTDKYVDYRFFPETLQAIHFLKTANYRIIALEITNTSRPISEFKMTDAEKICLVLGSERYGVSDKVLAQCDASYHIPMHGVNSSMNVTNACAIACFEITKIWPSEN